MGIKKYPFIDQHWSTDILYVDPKISGIIPKNMFKALKFAFHTENNDLFKSETFGKLRRIIEVLNEKFKKYYILSQKITVDETMIAFRGKADFIYYMPCKPTKIGIKMFSLCESKTGYCYAFKLAGGKNEEKKDYILTLINELLLGLENKGNILFMDSWFNSPRLFEILGKKGIACTGMIRKNITNFITKFISECKKDIDIASRNGVFFG